MWGWVAALVDLHVTRLHVVHVLRKRQRGNVKLSVIIPAYNEAKTIATTIERVQRTPYEKQIVVVDDASTDGTDAVLRQLSGITVVRHPVNRGKGAAIRTGIQHVSGDFVIIQDADLEYDPADYPALLAPLVDGRADAVYGSRFLGGPHRVLFFWHRVGNFVVTLAANIVANVNLSDMETGYKAFRTAVLKRLKLSANRFGFEPEVTVRLAQGHSRIYEVPISYSGRSYAEGKKITWRDGVAALWVLLRAWLVR